MTHPKDQIDTEALRLCAPAPGTEDEAPGPDDGLDDLCERWAAWCATRRFYVAPPTPHLLGRMRGNSRPLNPGGPDAEINAELAAFHIAYLGQPDALDRRVFELYYVHRIKPVKAAADALGISRQHFYAVLSAFRRRVLAASAHILSREESARAALPHIGTRTAE
jgi:hypothetical protein